MQPATPATVLGDFDDATFTHDGVTSSFFRRDGRFFVRTDGPDGALADFEVKYTFGLYPLQQYPIPFPDGRMQALSVAWDTRPREAGGGRWFHLYPGEHIDHRDELHWTGLQQNWNYMCADCHSTNLRRNYDPVRDRYATTWSDLAVGCEACHGPGSNHVAWAEKRPGWEKLAKGSGLTIPLDERRAVRWTITSTGSATRNLPLETHREVETYGVCHARRSPLGNDPGPTGRLLDTHDLALLEARLYHPDGQQLDEVYNYGSFLQSRMYAKGVACSDCHDPHTQQLERATLARPENARFAYVHAVALESLGRRDEAIAGLTRALERSPYDPDLLSALSTFNREAGHLPAAQDYARRLAAVAPDDERIPLPPHAPAEATDPSAPH